MRQAQTRPENQPQHPTLPEGMYLGHVKELLRRLRPVLELSRSRYDALLEMIESTASNDWHDPTRDAVCFRQQQDLARRLGKTDRAMRADEAALARAGFIENRSGNDGRRSGILLSGGQRLGISFAPLIERIPDLLSLRDEVDAEERQIAPLRLQASAARRELREALDRLVIAAPDHPEAAVLLNAYASLPRRYSAYRSTTDLKDHIRHVENTTDKVLNIITLSSKTSGAAESEIPAIIQSTNKPLLVSCNGSSVLKMPARKRADDKYSAAPNGAEEKGLENKYAASKDGDKTYDLDWLTPTILYSIASEECRFYLDAYRDGQSLTMRSFVKATTHRLSELGINSSAWDAAAEAMGNTRAALCVLVIDANRLHPTRPIHSPGGVLRAMTQRYANGKLNLAHSLIGLVNREKR